MERLTIKGGMCEMSSTEFCFEQKDCYDECSHGRQVFKRLAAYEDTGLEPEEMPTGLELANVYAAMIMLKQYEGIGRVEEFRALKDAEQKRQEGCGHWEEICSSVYLGVHYYACNICHEAALRD